MKTIPRKRCYRYFWIAAILLCDAAAGRIFSPNIEGERHAFYHHGLKKNFEGTQHWGDRSLPLFTNSLGFRDRLVREVSPSKNQRRVIIIGDSFTEGVGCPYEDTFVGLTEREFSDNVEILNAGVKSYSPKLYYLKMRYLVEQLGIRLDELFVYMDISDIQDEVVYERFIPSLPKNDPAGLFEFIDAFLKPNSFMYANLIRPAFTRLRAAAVKDEIESVDAAGASGRQENYYAERPRWTDDQDVYEKWGKRGIELAQSYMSKLVALCEVHGIRVTIAVYPWPHQIENRDVESLQVKIWQTFSEQHGTGFINYFPAFINDRLASEVIDGYFIEGDVHWNKMGHQIIADTLIKRIRANFYGQIN